MYRSSRPPKRSEVFIALLCALPVEASGLLSIFDTEWDVQQWQIQRSIGDENQYSGGTIDQHNVVLVHMSGMGTLAASSAAVNLKHSFVNIQLALVVGICGGMTVTPGGQAIFLGDIIISESLVQYDFGRLYPHGFQRKDTPEDSLDRQSPNIRAFLAKLKTEQCHARMYRRIGECLLQMNSATTSEAASSSLRKDKLFRSSYLHKHRDTAECDECGQGETIICQNAMRSTCEALGCQESALVVRQQCAVDDGHRLRIHFGRVGSGNAVLKSGLDRDRMAQSDGILALEMEGAGVWEHLPTIVVKGVCDYADSHKDKIWQKYAAGNAAACVKAMIGEWVAEEKISPDLAPSKESLLPFAACSNYVERTSYVNELKNFFKSYGQGSAKFVLWGLGGVGKTQIALSFATSQMPIFQIFWVRADNAENFLVDYRKVLELLNKDLALSLPRDDPKALLEATLIELEKQSSDWLLVLDNADDIEHFRKQADDRLCMGEYLPRIGRIIITTRDSRFVGEVVGMSDGIEVRSMTQTEGETLLHGSLPVSLQDGGDIRSDNSAAKLLKELGYLPLAIAQAAANMRYLQTPLQEYVQLYSEKRSRMELLSQPVHDPRRPPQSVLVTWEMSFEHVRKSTPLAADLLEYLGFIHWQSISRYLVRLLPEFGKCSDLSIRQMIAKLSHLSLLEIVDKDTIQLHPLVHYWLSARLPLDERKRYIQPWLQTMLTTFFAMYHKYREETFHLMPHAQALIIQAEEASIESTTYAGLMQVLANFAASVGMLNTANNLVSCALNMGLVVCQPTDLFLIHLRKSQALIYRQSANYSKALTGLQQCLEDLTSVEADQEVIDGERVFILEELIKALRDLGKYEAVAETQKELKIAKEMVRKSSNHSAAEEQLEDVLDKHNHAHNLMRLDFVDEAETLSNEVIQFSENEGKAIVMERLYLIFLNCRAHILIKRDDKEGALEIFRKVYNRSLEILRPDDVDLWIAAVNIESVLLDLGQWNELETIFGQIFKLVELESLQGVIAEKALKIINTMGIAKQKLGKYDEAEIYHRQALKVCVGLTRLWEMGEEAADGAMREQSAEKSQHPFYHILLYNIVLAAARQGRFDYMNTLRNSFLQEVTEAEGKFGRIEARLEQDAKGAKIHAEARQRLASEGLAAAQSQWWIENQSEIQLAEFRLGPVLDPDQGLSGEGSHSRIQTDANGSDEVDKIPADGNTEASTSLTKVSLASEPREPASSSKSVKKSVLPVLSKLGRGFWRPKGKGRDGT